MAYVKICTKTLIFKVVLLLACFGSRTLYFGPGRYTVDIYIFALLDICPLSL